MQQPSEGLNSGSGALPLMPRLIATSVSWDAAPVLFFFLKRKKNYLQKLRSEDTCRQLFLRDFWTLSADEISVSQDVTESRLFSYSQCI